MKTLLKKQNISYLLLAASILSAMSLFSCATNPVTKKKDFVLMSEEQEFRVGKDMDPEIRKEYGVYPSLQLQKYIESIGERIAKKSDRPDIYFHFTVLDSPIVNAFSLPGGYIYVTRGILAYLNSEAELAGVLAHEIGHVTARHAVRQYTKAATYQIATGIASIFVPELQSASQFSDFMFILINSGYSREYETESDRLSVTYLASAGYDPKAVASVLKILKLLDSYNDEKSTQMKIFASHPETALRIADVENLLSEGAIQFSSNPVTGRENYFAEIDGLVFGDNINNGVVKANRFQHPDLRIELLFPEGWSIKNMPDAIIAKDPNQDIQLELGQHQLYRKQSMADIAKALTKRTGLKEISGSSQKINGLEAYTGTFEGSSVKGGYVLARMGFFLIRDRVFIIIGSSESAYFNKALPLFESSINSFKELSQAEADKIRSNQIHIYKVKKAQSFVTIIKELGWPEDYIKTFSLINGWDPKAVPALMPGMLIKVLKNKE